MLEPLVEYYSLRHLLMTVLKKCSLLLLNLKTRCLLLSNNFMLTLKVKSGRSKKVFELTTVMNIDALLNIIAEIMVSSLRILFRKHHKEWNSGKDKADNY